MLSFNWGVFNRGYRWIDETMGYTWWPATPGCGDDLWRTRRVEAEARAIFLSTGEAVDRRRPCWTYSPLQHPALFRNFADIEPDPESILAFANEHGLLRRDNFHRPVITDGWPVPGTWDFEHVLLHPQIDPGKGTRSWVYGERLSEWQLAILEMRQIVGLWRMIRAGAHDELAAHIRWQGPDEIVYDSDFGRMPETFTGECNALEDSASGVFLHTRAIIASSAGEHWQLLETIPEGDCARAAVVYLQRKISARLGQDIVPDILPNANRPNRLDVGLRPLTLSAAMWLQVAYSISDGRHYRKCPQCDRWFQTPESRGNRLYCESSACRNVAYRQRKERAREMYRNGLSAMAIAKEIGSGVDVVERWLKAGYEPKRPKGRPRKEA